MVGAQAGLMGGEDALVVGLGGLEVVLGVRCGRLRAAFGPVVIIKVISNDPTKEATMPDARRQTDDP